MGKRADTMPAMTPGTTRKSDAVSDADGQAFPRAFGNYVLLTNFAQGGMGEVYLAKTGGIAGIDRLCVLKKLRADVNREDEYVRRFTDEARIVVQLSHANICHVFDAGQVGNQMYLAMEYVPGANLRDIFSRARKVPVDEPDADLSHGLAASIVSEVLDALDYAHRLKHPLTGLPLNVVHRDVSPQNILVSFEGEVKLIDFGLAKSDIKTEQTESQVVMGKVAYMSPEQARGEEVSPATDQFAAGVALYEIATKQRFYGEFTNYQIWQVVGRGGFLPAALDLLHPDLARIISRATHKDAHRRFEDCGEFKEALELFVRKNYPQVTKRHVREMMLQLYGADQERERTFLAQFAHVSASNARAPQSGPVHMSFVTETQTAVDGSGVPAAAPPGDKETPAIAEDAGATGEDLPWHARTETAAANSGAVRALGDLPLAEGGVFGPPSDDATSAVRQTEHTEVVSLGAGHRPTDASSTNAAMAEAYGTNRRPVWVAGLAIIALLGVIVFMMTRERGGEVVATTDPAIPNATAPGPEAEDTPAVEPAALPEPAAAAVADPAATGPTPSTTKKVVASDSAMAKAGQGANRVTPRSKRDPPRIARASEAKASARARSEKRTAADAVRARKRTGTKDEVSLLPPLDVSKASTWGHVMPYLQKCTAKCALRSRSLFVKENLGLRSPLGAMHSVVAGCIQSSCKSVMR